MYILRGRLTVSPNTQLRSYDMFYSRTTRPLPLILGLAALLVTGCGGGGDDGVKEDLRAQVDMLEADLAAGREAQTAAETAKETAEAAQATAEKERDDANIAKGAAEELMRMAQQAQQEADTARQEAETAKMMAETAQRQAVMSRDAALQDKMQAETDLAAANTSKSMTEGELDMVRQDLADANIALTTANTNLQAANANLMTANANLATAIQERDDARTAEQQARIELARVEGQLDQARQQLTQAQQDVLDAERESQQAQEEANRRIADAEEQANIRLRAGPLLMDLAAEVGNFEDGDEDVAVTYEPGESVKFEPTGGYTPGSGAPSISGWRRASFSRNIGVKATDTVYLYTNIGSPARKEFWQVYGVDEDVGSNNSGMARTSGSRRVDQGGTADNPADDVVTYRGSLHGASGTFSCIGGGDMQCMLTNADMASDGLTINGTWKFKPSSLENRVGEALADDAFLYFGIWIREPQDASDTMTPDFKWIAGGDAEEINNFTDLVGTATLNGDAVGKYVLRNQVDQADRIGTFTADVSLTADFDGNTLGGNITGFREGGNSLTGWSVYLGMSDSAPATLGAAGTSGTLVTTARVGGVGATGVWNATLYGSDNMIIPLDDRDDYPLSRYPAANVAGVAGWFNAKDGTDPAGSNVAIAGAFAAAP